jgi:[ribosomal protein S5]-alanine N-acetyltransferase
MKMNHTLHTSRLILRPLEPSDAPVLHRIYQAEGVLRYFPNPVPPSLERVQRFIDRQQQHWEQHGCGHWAVQAAGEPELAGWAGLQVLPELGETELAYLLAPSHWGRGYASEAARAALQFGFEQAVLDHIIALVHPQNTVSQRVILKCGMSYLETIQLWGMELMRFHLPRLPIEHQTA